MTEQNIKGLRPQSTGKLNCFPTSTVGKCTLFVAKFLFILDLTKVLNFHWSLYIKGIFINIGET